MGLIIKTLDVLLPFRKAAKQQLDTAADGAAWIREGVKQLQRPAASTADGAPANMTEARARFDAAAERYGRNTARHLLGMETDLARRHMVFVIAALVCFSLGFAGIILIFVDGFWSGIGLSMGIPMGGYSTASALRYGLRCYQVNQRALVPLPVYVRAAGGWWPAIVFGATRK
jgi:hypothetical protein